MAIKIRRARNLFWRMRCPNKLLRSLLLRMKDYYILIIFSIRRLEYWIVLTEFMSWVVLHLKSPFLIGVSKSFRSVHSISISVKKFSFQVILRKLFLQTETRLCGNYSCESGLNLKINLVKMSQKFIFAIINYLFLHFIHSFL